jgi:hypothetical protein
MESTSTPTLTKPEQALKIAGDLMTDNPMGTAVQATKDFGSTVKGLGSAVMERASGLFGGSK